jgi:mono/diheme cytochrome c family protein
MEGPRLINDNSFSRSKGGYFIDVNSGNPTTSQTAMDSLEKTAGLCVLCHGSDVDGMDFYPGSSLWRPDTVNGHSNSTLGGTRANARNLFDGGPSDRNVPHGMTAQLELGVWENTDGSFYWYYGTGGCDCPPAWSGWYPLADRDNWYNPGGIGGAWGAGTMAHKFTCSKCHTPHASGLPALLTTNCIDVRLPNPAGGWGHGLYPESSNCHRKSSVADGWHRLAPAQ